jgi:hypothetical protein
MFPIYHSRLHVSMRVAFFEPLPFFFNSLSHDNVPHKTRRLIYSLLVSAVFFFFPSVG